MQNDPIDVFIGNLIEEKKLPGLDEETRVQVAADLKELLMANINKALIQAVPEENLDELEGFLDNQSADQAGIQQFIEQHVDVKQIMQNELVLFRSLYLGEA